MWSQFLVFLWALVMPIIPAIVTTGVLIVADFTTGLYAAYRTKEVITSRRMRDTIDKIFIYNVSILLAHLIEKYMVAEAIPVLRIALGFIVLAEFKSISENFHKITGVNMYEKIMAYLKKKHDIEI
jgi:phage-related holin